MPTSREHAVEQPTGRADEGPAFAVFLIARLLADEGDVGADRPFAQHGMVGARRQRLRSGDRGD